MQVKKKAKIINRLGLHARAAAKLTCLAEQFHADIYIQKEGQKHTANAKSIMGVMMLAAAQGSSIYINAEGQDAEEAINALLTLIAERFGESE